MKLIIKVYNKVDLIGYVEEDKVYTPVNNDPYNKLFEGATFERMKLFMQSRMKNDEEILESKAKSVKDTLAFEASVL